MEFTREQESINALIHFIGLGIGVVAVPFLIVSVFLAPYSTDWDLFGASVYGLGFIMVFTFSSLYHHFRQPKHKNRLEIWDHIAIYIMIAGTYTPFILAYAVSEERFVMLGVVWSLAIVGSVLKIFFTGRFRIFSMLIYVAMGLMILAAPASFKAAIPAEQASWILAGVLVYMAGLIFYLCSFFRHHHAVWHFFVLGGALCHYVGIFKMFI